MILLVNHFVFMYWEFLFLSLILNNSDEWFGNYSIYHISTLAIMSISWGSLTWHRKCMRSIGGILGWCQNWQRNLKIAARGWLSQDQQKLLPVKKTQYCIIFFIWLWLIYWLIMRQILHLISSIWQSMTGQDNSKYIYL